MLLRAVARNDVVQNGGWQERGRATGCGQVGTAEADKRSHAQQRAAMYPRGRLVALRLGGGRAVGKHHGGVARAFFAGRDGGFRPSHAQRTAPGEPTRAERFACSCPEHHPAHRTSWLPLQPHNFPRRTSTTMQPPRLNMSLR